MAWQLLAAALPAAAKVAGTALSKPKQEDFAPQTDYMKKYLSYLRGRTSDREVMHLAMQPALRVAGKQGRQMQRQVGYDVAKSGLGGSGIEAQMRLSAGQQTQEALATATDKAVAAQAAETSRVGERAAGITAQIGAEEARADQAFKSAESQWKRQLTSDVIGAGASLASAGITQAGQLNEAKLMAERSGYFGSGEDVQKMIDQGWTPQMLQQESARVEKQVNTLLGSGVELSDIHAELGLGAGYTGAVSSIEEEIVSTTDKPSAGHPKLSGAEYQESAGAETDIVSTTDEPPVVKATEEAKPDWKTIEDESLAAVQAEKERYAKVIEAGGYATSNKPPEQLVKDIRPVSRKNPDGSESTVLMAQSDNLAYPTLFPKDPKNPSSDPADWIELEGDAAFNEAKKRGEVYAFKSEEEAIAFAEGSWKTIEELKTVEVEADPAALAAQKAAKAAAASKTAAEKYAAKVKAEEKAAAAKTVTEGAGRAAERKAKLAEEARLDAIEQRVYKETKERLTKEAKAQATVTAGAKRVRDKNKRIAEQYAAKVRGATTASMKEEREKQVQVGEPDEKTLDAVVNTVTKFESGDRSERHNNPGAMVWSPKLQEEYPEIEKGDSFTKDGKTYYTAKFKDKATGERINKEIISKIWKEVGGDTLKFYSRWSGLPKDSATVKNYAEEIKRLTGA